MFLLFLLFLSLTHLLMQLYEKLLKAKDILETSEEARLPEDRSFL